MSSRRNFPSLSGACSDTVRLRSGNPLDKAAYEKLERTSAALADGLAKAAAEAKVPVQVNRVGSMLTVFFSEKPVFDAASARACSTRRFAAWYHALLEGGVYFPPSQFEAAFLSTAHGDAEVDATLAAPAAADRRVE